MAHFHSYVTQSVSSLSTGGQGEICSLEQGAVAISTNALDQSIRLLPPSAIRNKKRARRHSTVLWFLDIFSWEVFRNYNSLTFWCGNNKQGLLVEHSHPHPVYSHSRPRDPLNDLPSTTYEPLSQAHALCWNEWIVLLKGVFVMAVSGHVGSQWGTTIQWGDASFF